MNLAPERIELAQKKVREDPYDTESWQMILKDAQGRPIDDVREVIYEKLMTYFPTSGKFWKAYIEHEIKYRNYERVEKLFQRCLMKVLSIELWKTYLQYVKETKSKLPTYKEKMAHAYDFALDNMGMDINSYAIWDDYVNHLKSVDASGNYAEGQKITAIRKMYQRGVTNPMIGIETLWKDYVEFEQSINPIIAEKLVSEKSRDYMNARRVSKEYEACTRGLNKSASCVPPTGSAEEKKQVELWQKYISWEKSNPLKVEDQTLITKRVMFAYEQCLLCLGHHPNIWLEAALFLQDSAKILADKGDVDNSKMFLDQTEAFYDRVTTGVLNKCMLLHFAYADFEEQQMKHEKVHSIYTKFLEIKEVNPTLCYIQYMKFCRRAEGTASARKVFKKAREDTRATEQVYIAAALMEYFCTKDRKIATNVFELGFKTYKNNPNYVQEYIKFLFHLNEDNNTRVLFERALTSDALSPEQTIEIWNKFLEFETNVGDLAGIRKVYTRRAQAFDISETLTSCPSARMIDRYRFNDLLPCSQDELSSMGYEYSNSSDSQNKTTAANSNGGASGTNSGNNASSSNSENITNGTSKIASETVKNFKPDTSQMVPFKPKFKWVQGEHRLPGGGFPLPPAAEVLCQTLPPPDSFQGPFVQVDRMMESFMNMRLPNEYIPPTLTGNDYSHSSRLFDTAKAAAWNDPPPDSIVSSMNNDNSERALSKARSVSPSGSLLSDNAKRMRFSKSRSREPKSDDEEDSNSSAPVNDLYRQRQQKKNKL